MTTTESENYINIPDSTLNSISESSINLEFPPLPSKHVDTAPQTIQQQTAGMRPKTFSKTITLPIEEQRRPTLGEKLIPAEIARSVMKATGVDIDMSSSALTHTITMVVRGVDEDKVAEACRTLRARLAMPMKSSLLVPVRALGSIVGKGGRIVKSIMQETGARIVIPNAEPCTNGEETQAEVTIEGPGESCNIARQRIETIVKEVINHAVEQIEIVGLVDFFLCGPQHSRSLAVFQSEFPLIKFSLSSGKLTLAGSIELVSGAKEIILEKIMKIEREIKKVTITVPKHVHKHLVGVKGSTLHAFVDASKCLIEIPPPEDTSDIVTIYGYFKDLTKALQLIVDKSEEFHEELIACPFLIKSFLMHKHRHELRAIEKDNTVQLRQDVSGFVAIGTRPDGERARLQLKSMIQGFVDLHFDTIYLKKEWVSHVIGRQGQGLERLEKEFGVDVIIDDNCGDHLILFVDSDASAINRAKEAVTLFINALENEDVKEIDIEERFVPDVIKAVKGIQEAVPEYSVYFSHQANKLRIRGPKGRQLEECYRFVKKNIESIEWYLIEHSHTQEISIPSNARERLSLGNLRTKLDLPTDLAIEYLSMEKSILVLKGTEFAVAEYTSRIKQYLEQLADHLSITFPVEPELVGKLIGKGGKNIQPLYDRYPTTSIRIDRDSREIILSGPSQAVNECSKELKVRIEETRRHSHVKEVSVTRAVINRLLFKQAKELDDMQKIYKVRIMIDHHDDASSRDERRMRVEGEERLVQECIEKLSKISWEEFEQNIDMDNELMLLLKTTFQSYFRYFVQTKVSSKVRVFLLDDAVKVRGPKDQVESAITIIKEQLLQDFEDNYSVQVICVEQRYHGLIIGQRGATVKKIMQTFDVTIDISKDPEDNNKITVTGRHVEGAIQEILSICDE